MRIAGHGNKYESNQETQSQSFGIGDPSVVIEILRNRLYEHKIRTLVQEYMSNARDAHRETKQTRRIEVVAPTQLEPTFKVRDFGPGISPERMANVFVLYGASTKRSSNNQTGGFGIGAKSAWSYADGFIIQSTVDGIRRTYNAHVGASNVGQLDLIETSNTDQPNGCEIQIAVNPRDCAEFQSSIKRACYFWNESERPVLKNVTVPEMLKGYEMGPLLVASGDSPIPDFIAGYGRHNLLVIDGIPYTLTDDLRRKVESLDQLNGLLNGAMIIKVPNGLVQVGANREKVDDSDFTRKGLTKIGTKLVADVNKHIQDKINAIATVKGFVETYHSMYKFFRMASNEYKGFRFDGTYLYTTMLGSVHFQRYSVFNDKVKGHGVKGIPFEQLNNIFLQKSDENTVTFNRRVKAHVASNAAKDMYVIRERATSVMQKDGTVQQLKFEIAPSKAIKELQSILGTFKDFHAITFVVPPRTPKALKAAKLSTQQSFHLLYGSGRDIVNKSVQELQAKGKTYIYMLICEWQDADRKSAINSMVREFRGDFNDTKCKKPIFIAVSNATYNIIKDEAGFVPYAEWITSVQITDKLRYRMMAAKTLNTNVVQVLGNLDGIKNKKLTKIVDQYKLIGKHASLNRHDNDVPEMLVKMFKDDAEYQAFLAQDAEVKSLIETEYPLLKHVDRGGNAELRRELTWYLNNK